MARRLQKARKATKKSMAPASRRTKTAKAGAGQENARLRRELREALERQKATGDILAAISNSTSDLQSILDTIVRTASRLCDADFAQIYKLHHGQYHGASQRIVVGHDRHYIVNCRFVKSSANVASQKSQIVR
jgi:hypothetical protein